METIDLTIPTMKSPHCQLTVRNAVTNSGAKVKSIYPSRLIVEVSDGIDRGAVIGAIEKQDIR